jgi:hypothetical protein
MRGFFNGLVLGVILGAVGYWFIQNKASVSSDQGHVALSGTVSAEDDIGKAVALALEADGARDVTSTITVKPKSRMGTGWQLGGDVAGARFTGARFNRPALAMPVGLGEHPIAPALLLVLACCHEKTTSLPQPAAGRAACAAAEPGPIWKPGPFVRRRNDVKCLPSFFTDGHEGFLPELATGLGSGMRSADDVAPRQKSEIRLPSMKFRVYCLGAVRDLCWPEVFPL